MLHLFTYEQLVGFSEVPSTQILRLNKSGIKRLSAAVRNLVNERVCFGYPLSALGGWLVRYTLQPRVQLPLDLVCGASADVLNVPWKEIEQSCSMDT